MSSDERRKKRVICLLVILAFLRTEKRLPFLRDMLSIKALLLFCVIALPWFIIICLREDETLPFYLKRRTYIAEYPDSRDHFLDKKGFAKMFRSDRPVFVVLKAKRLSWLEAADIEGGALIAHHAGRQLIANRTTAAALPSVPAHVF